eukprot:TRINITY_DN411_c0_g1_i2.p2 TRINITY_DN411_c0_g1~~TRINITY_DN411_c0_g1_i2.p2  ORF type:complete len:186 (-),score=8.22 TRINITY_DN411_c0_g1_i2:4-525(-)
MILRGEMVPRSLGSRPTLPCFFQMPATGSGSPGAGAVDGREGFRAEVGLLYVESSAKEERVDHVFAAILRLVVEARATLTPAPAYRPAAPRRTRTPDTPAALVPHPSSLHLAPRPRSRQMGAMCSLAPRFRPVISAHPHPPLWRSALSALQMCPFAFPPTQWPRVIVFAYPEL